MENFGSEDLFSVFDGGNKNSNTSHKRKYESQEGDEMEQEVRQVRPRKIEETRSLIQKTRLEKSSTIPPQQQQTITEQSSETLAETKEVISCQHDVCLPPSIPGKKQW